jgi:predicted negative regulator of RcsB-dependent stress response
MASTLEPDLQPSHPLSRRSDDSAGDWLRVHGRSVGIGVAAIAAAGLGGLLWRTTERNKAERAERAFFEAQTAAQGGPPAVERAMRPLSTRYPGTAGGAQATLLLVQSLYDQGKYQDGLGILARSKLPDEFADGAQLLNAAGLEGAGRAAEAARVYERLAGATGLVARRRDELRASAARAYQLAGDRASARRLWQQIVTDNASPLVDEARVRVGELSAS